MSNARRTLKLLTLKHRQKMEYIRVERKRRLEILEAELILVDQRCRRLAEQITPSNARLDLLAILPRHVEWSAPESSDDSDCVDVAAGNFSDLEPNVIDDEGSEEKEDDETESSS